MINEELNLLSEQAKKITTIEFPRKDIVVNPNQKPTDKVFPGGMSMNDIEAMSEEEQDEYWDKVSSGEIK
jgi:hypothetical protein